MVLKGREMKGGILFYFVLFLSTAEGNLREAVVSHLSTLTVTRLLRLALAIDY